MYQHAQNKQQHSNQHVVVQQHIYNHYQQQQQNIYNMNNHHSNTNNNSISAHYLLNSGSSGSSNNIQSTKASKKEKQQVIPNSKSKNLSIGTETQSQSEIEKKLLHYIPSLIHDLRNPLQQLFACIELYKQQLNLMQNPLYEILSHSVSHMNELITKSLTTFKKIIDRKDDESVCELSYQNIDISKYLEEFWTNNLAIAEQKPNVDYQILVQSTLPHYVNIPKLEVTQVIQNLFSNATKFTEKGSIKLIVSFHEISSDDEDADLSINTQENEVSTTKNKDSSHSYLAYKGLHNSCNLQNIKNSKVMELDLEDLSGSSHKHSSKQQQHDIMNKVSYDGGKESSPFEQDVSIAMDVSQKLHSQQVQAIQEALSPASVRQIAHSVGNGGFKAHVASLSQPQFNSATTIPLKNGREIGSQKLQKKLQSITYQFDKLKYSQQQDNDYQMNTEEDVDEDYTESESSQPCAHLPPSYSTQHKPLDGYSEYYQNNSQNNTNATNHKQSISSTGQQKKTQPSYYSLSSQTHLNLYITAQQGNGATPKSSNNNGANFDSAQNNHILSFNQIENSYTSSTSRSCHNSTPPTFQIHTFSDIQNAKNTNFQQQNLIKSQQLSGSSRQTPGENSLPIHDYSTQYHTPQMNPKNDLQTSKYHGFNNSDQPQSYNNASSSRKGQIIHSQSQNNINQQFGKEIGSKNFLTEYPSPDALSIHSQSKTGGGKGRNNINSFSSDMNGEIKNVGNNEEQPLKQSLQLSRNHQNPYQSIQNHTLPGSADLEGQKKSMTLSTVMKQQQQNKQHKQMVQSTISNSYYYNCQQKQISQSSGDLRSLKNHQLVGPIHNPALNSSKMNEITEKVKIDGKQQLYSQEDQSNLSQYQSHQQSQTQISIHQSHQSEKLPNNNEFCQIFSKRKSQIHPSIRDLVFSRNNIRHYQIRRIAQIRGYLKFEILDTGKGMDENEQKRIFDIYQQANHSIKEQYGGSGIGLYSAKNIANQLSGDIFCHSQKGVGSAFIFYMPCNATYKTETSKESKDQIKSSFSKSINLQQPSNKMQNNYITPTQYRDSELPLIDIQQQQNLSNPSSQSLKSNQDKQQQLQIMQIKQGLKSADCFHQKMEQQNKLIVIKQQPNSTNSPSEQKEEEIQQLILQLEEKKKKIKLIYIDDNDFLLQAMVNLLTKIKVIDLKIEKSPKMGLETIRSNPNKFDVALIDHDMPELNGKSLAKQIKQINPNIILICHSGYPINDDFQAECIQSGFSYYLQKPCFIENIVILLCQVFRINTSYLKYINTSLQSYKLQANY